MDRIRVKEVGVSHQMEAYTFQGDDGYPTSKVFSPVYAVTEDGRSWFLPQGQQSRCEEGFVYYAYRYRDTDRMADRVIRAGTIDPDLWVEVDQRSLSEILDEEFELEQRDRAEHGYPFF